MAHNTGKPVGKTLVVALIVTLTSSAFAAVLAIVSLNGSPISDGDRKTFWENRLLDCSNGVSQKGSDGQIAGECVADALYAALTEGSIKQFGTAATEVTAKDPWLNSTCHEPTHGLGRRILEHYGEDWRRALLEATWDFCDSGALHGLYDLWGEERHSTQDWLRLARLCQESMAARVNGCPDAVGHAAYESLKQEPAAAMEICALIETRNYARDCAMGVVMQHYNPNNPALVRQRGNQIPGPEQWPMIFRLCDVATSGQKMTEAVRTGCVAGAGWMMGVFISEQSDGYQPDREGIEGRRTELIHMALDHCVSTAGEQATECTNMLFRRPPLNVTSSSTKVLEFCRQSTEGRSEKGLRLTCLANALPRMSHSERTALIGQEPSVSEIANQVGLGFKI